MRNSHPSCYLITNRYLIMLNSREINLTLNEISVSEYLWSLSIFHYLIAKFMYLFENVDMGIHSQGYTSRTDFNL